MIIQIYKTLRQFDWTIKGIDQSNNKRLFIKKCFIKNSQYCEVFTEWHGFSVHLYGGNWMNGYYPTVIDICNLDDIKYLQKRLIK